MTQHLINYNKWNQHFQFQTFSFNKNCKFITLIKTTHVVGVSLVSGVCVCVCVINYQLTVNMYIFVSESEAQFGTSSDGGVAGGRQSAAAPP